MRLDLLSLKLEAALNIVQETASSRRNPQLLSSYAHQRRDLTLRCHRYATWHYTNLMVLS